MSSPAPETSAIEPTSGAEDANQRAQPTARPDWERGERLLDSTHPWVVLLLVVLALLLAYRCRFVQDDAFIAFSYARNLLEGLGLTWFGARVEGYTSFLWVVLLSLGMRIGIEPVAFATTLGMLSFAFVVWATNALGFRASGSRLVALGASVLLIGNFSVLSYSTGGLETMLQTALFAGIALLVTRQDNDRATALGISILAALALLLRLDSAVPIAVLGGFWLHGYVKRKVKLALYVILLLPALVAVGAWLAWKLWYYGLILPNTFYAKIADVLVPPNGLLFLGRFLHDYLLWPFLTLGAVAMVVARKRLPKALLPLLTAIVAWFAYIIWAGGDFMEFRFLVPVAPYLFVLVATLIVATGRELLGKPLLTLVGALAILLAASWRHATCFVGTTGDLALDSIPALATFYGVYPDRQWQRIGERLRHELGETDAIIATHAVGAIPYYSRLRTIDMWGLNDPTIARAGAPRPASFRRPGHHRHATLAYLREQRANFVIGHPRLVRPGVVSDPRSLAMLKAWVPATLFFNKEPIGNAIVIAIPINARSSLLAWYLAPTERLDRLIRDRHWERVTLTDVR
jgi:arabinofuranosyltransferase